MTKAFVSLNLDYDVRILSLPAFWEGPVVTIIIDNGKWGH